MSRGWFTRAARVRGGGAYGRAAAIIAVVLLAASSADAADKNLAVGRVHEHGRGVRGHGQVLRQALGYELSGSGAFRLVADDEAKKAALDRVRATNRHHVDEAQWVELGRAVGATHLLLGEVRQDRNTCTAFAQLVHLETRSTRVSRPGYYDCTQHDLVELAGDLSQQLTGQRTSPPSDRTHRQPPPASMEIVMRGREAKINGEDYTIYDSHRQEAPPPVEEDRTAPSAPPEDDLSVPNASPDGRTAPSAPLDEIPPTAEPEPVPAPPTTLDPDAWSGLQPSLQDDGTPMYNLFAFAADLRRQAALTTGTILGLPILFILVGGLLTRLRRSAGIAVLRLGFAVSVVVLAADLAVILLYRHALMRPLLEDAGPLLVAAPIMAVTLWLVGTSMLGLGGQMRRFRQLLWLLMMSATFAIVLLICSQIQVPMIYVALCLLMLWLGLRLALHARERRGTS